MILSIPLQPGTNLSAVRYRWIVGGIEQSEQSTGISQPDINFPLFLFNVTPPANAEEIVAYDNTDLSNWNVGQYELFAAGPPPGPTIITIVPSFGTPGLRTVSFKSVYESVLRQHGFDPTGDAITHDTLRAAIDQINAQVLYGWRYWEWPQLELLQERAFRTVWTSTLQFYQVNSELVPDEVYDRATQLYYRVKATAPSSPPIGTPVTNTTYWEVFDLTDRYISLDQVNQTPIGEVIEIFKSDPRLAIVHDADRVRFRPSEHEVQVVGCANATVFVDFRIAPSQFTGVPFVAGRSYALGDAIYNPANGECYRALQDSPTGDPTAQPTQWLKIPFPMIFSQYVTLSAYAAGLGESDPLEKDANALTHRRALMAAASQAADEALEQEVDRLRAQGQHYRYKRWRPTYRPAWWRYPGIAPNAA